MSYFFQIVVSGVVVGSIYALAALGLVLVYKSSRVANFAHGQIIAAGGRSSSQSRPNPITSMGSQFSR